MFLNCPSTWNTKSAVFPWSPPYKKGNSEGEKRSQKDEKDARKKRARTAVVLELPMSSWLQQETPLRYQTRSLVTKSQITFYPWHLEDRAWYKSPLHTCKTRNFPSFKIRAVWVGLATAHWPQSLFPFSGPIQHAELRFWFHVGTLPLKRYHLIISNVLLFSRTYMPGVY